MIIPPEWTFKNVAVASEFDSHVREQLPWYDLVTSAVAHIARHYLPENGLLYDIGSSNGNLGRNMAESIKARSARLVAIDNSPEMISQYNAPGDPICADAMTFDYEAFDVGILFLVLMFMPVASRNDFLRGLINKVKSGGCLIIVDKIAVNNGYISTVLHRLTMAGKVAAGCDMAKVTQKELSLGGVQRPLPHDFGSRLKRIDCHTTEFFRFGEFVGWVIEIPQLELGRDPC